MLDPVEEALAKGKGPSSCQIRETSLGPTAEKFGVKSHGGLSEYHEPYLLPSTTCNVLAPEVGQAIGMRDRAGASRTRIKRAPLLLLVIELQLQPNAWQLSTVPLMCLLDVNHAGPANNLGKNPGNPHDDLSLPCNS